MTTYGSLSDSSAILAEVIAGELDQRADVQSVSDAQLPMQDLIAALVSGMGGDQTKIESFLNTWGAKLDWLADLDPTWASAIQKIIDNISAGVGNGENGNTPESVEANIKALLDLGLLADEKATLARLEQQKQQQQNNTGSGGLNRLLTFPTGPLSTTDWTFNPSMWTAYQNAMALTSNTTAGWYLARTNYSFTTDDQAMIVQLGAEQNNDQYTYLCLRTNNSGNEGVACRVSANSISLGVYVKSGEGDTGSMTFQPAQVVSRSVVSGQSIEFRAVGDTFTVFHNGNSVISYSSPLGGKGSSYRNSAIIKQKAFGAFGIQFYSFNLTSVGIFDFGSAGSAVSSRTSAKVSRLATAEASFSLGNAGDAAFPANFFGVSDFAQDVTITDAGLGKFTITKAGWYRISCSFFAMIQTSSLNPNQWAAVDSHWCLYVNGQKVAPVMPTGGSLDWALKAGDVIQPGVVSLKTRTQGSDGAVEQPTSITGLRGGPGAFFQVLFDNPA